ARDRDAPGCGHDTPPGEAYREARGDDDVAAGSCPGTARWHRTRGTRHERVALVRPPALGPATLAGKFRRALPDRRRSGSRAARAAGGKAERSGRSPVRVAARQWGRGAAASAPLFRCTE